MKWNSKETTVQKIWHILTYIYANIMRRLGATTDKAANKVKVDTVYCVASRPTLGPGES